MKRKGFVTKEHMGRPERNLFAVVLGEVRSCRGFGFVAMVNMCEEAVGEVVATS